MFRDRTGPMLFRAETVPETVPVLSVVGIGFFTLWILWPWPSYMNLTHIPSTYTRCTNINFLCQGFRKLLSSDRHIDRQERNYILFMLYQLWHIITTVFRPANVQKFLSGSFPPVAKTRRPGKAKRATSWRAEGQGQGWRPQGVRCPSPPTTTATYFPNTVKLR